MARPYILTWAVEHFRTTEDHSSFVRQNLVTLLSHWALINVDVADRSLNC